MNIITHQGAVVHKLMGHKASIVYVAFTSDSNMAITGNLFHGYFY